MESFIAKSGRPTKYKPKYCNEIIDYFEMCSQELERFLETPSLYTIEMGKSVRFKPFKFPTLYKFAASIGVCRDTLHEWGKVYPKFSDSISRCKSIQAHMALMMGINDLGNAYIINAMLKNNHGWKDKPDDENKNKPSTILIDEQDKDL